MMTKRELRKYKKKHCFHSCNHCEYKEMCWEELGVEEDSYLLPRIILYIVIPTLIGFGLMYWLICIICAGFMM